MRGKDDLNLFQKVVKGITPAYAGKSAVRFRSDFAEQDHPRLCGEKSSGTLTPKTDPGSPPPMRGKGGTTTVTEITEGITPAYAGKSYIYIILYITI